MLKLLFTFVFVIFKIMYEIKMKPVSEERMRLRLEYSRETDLIFSDNIPAYADWLEKKLALSQPPVIGSLPSDELIRERGERF
jgi:hypothetical protein